jgi:hypothetical protein
MKFVEDYEDGFDPSLTNDFEDNFNDENFVEPEMAEVEVVLDEPTRMVDVDGSVVLAEPGDTITIKSESLKRIKQ